MQSVVLPRHLAGDRGRLDDILTVFSRDLQVTRHGEECSPLEQLYSFKFFREYVMKIGSGLRA